MRTKELTPRQLAWLMGIKVSSAEDILIVAEAKDKGKKPDLDHPPRSLSVGAIERHLNIELVSKIEDIENNYTKRHVTRGWISDFPQRKIDQCVKLGKKLPATIQPPAVLRSFLSEEQRRDIVGIWNARYESYTKVIIFK